MTSTNTVRAASPAAAAKAAPVLRRNGAFARIDIFDDIAAVEGIWRRLEREGALATPYQSFDLMSSWYRHVGTREAVQPRIVAGFDAAGRPACLLPFGRSRLGPLGIIGFLGGKHANFNFGLWRRDLVAALSASDVQDIFRRIAAAGGGDVCNLLRQPRSWEGIGNPLALLPHQPSPSGSMRLELSRPGDALVKSALSSAMRGRLRTKERRLRQLDGYRYFRATSAAEVDRLLDVFFPLKAAHMAAMGLSNIFAEPGQENFLRECCHHGIADGKPLIELHALETANELLAVFAGITDRRRFSGMFNTYTRSDNARQSPGLILLTHIVANLADRGFRSFDLGVGEAHYKTFFCKEPEPLFDSFLPLTPLGRLAAIATREGSRLKRQVKQSQALWSLVQLMRRSFRGAAPAKSGGES